jgi:hypothetical protein
MTETIKKRGIERRGKRGRLQRQKTGRRGETESEKEGNERERERQRRTSQGRNKQ